MTSEEEPPKSPPPVQLDKALLAQVNKLEKEGNDFLADDKPEQAARSFEQLLKLRISYPEFTAEERDKDFVRLVQLLHNTAKSAEAKKDPAYCERLLSEADAVIGSCRGHVSAQPYRAMQVMVYTTVALFLNRTGKPRTSLKYFGKVLQLETALKLSTAATHLNLCAVLSHMGRHHRALDEAQQCLVVLGQADEAGLRAAAHHSIAVQLEYLGRRADAQKAYKQAEALASEADNTSLKKSITRANTALTKHLSDFPHTPLTVPPTMHARLVATTKFDPSIHSPRVAQYHASRPQIPAAGSSQPTSRATTPRGGPPTSARGTRYAPYASGPPEWAKGSTVGYPYRDRPTGTHSVQSGWNSSQQAPATFRDSNRFAFLPPFMTSGGTGNYAMGSGAYGGGAAGGYPSGSMTARSHISMEASQTQQQTYRVPQHLPVPPLPPLPPSDAAVRRPQRRVEGQRSPPISPGPRLPADSQPLSSPAAGRIAASSAQPQVVVVPESPPKKELGSPEAFSVSEDEDV